MIGNEVFMKDFFTTTVGSWDDGSVRMTAPGIAIVTAVIALLIIIAAIVRQRKAAKKEASGMIVGSIPAL